MRTCSASWRWTGDRTLLTAHGPLRRTSRTPHRPGSPVPGFPEHAVDKQNGCSLPSTASQPHYSVARGGHHCGSPAFSLLT